MSGVLQAKNKVEAFSHAKSEFLALQKHKNPDSQNKQDPAFQLCLQYASDSHRTDSFLFVLLFFSGLRWD